MRFTKTILTLAVCGLGFTTINAAVPQTEQSNSNFGLNKFYLNLETGASLPMGSNIQVADDGFWAVTPEGYNSKLKTSFLLGGALGYIINSKFRVELGVTYRPSFDYSKYQSSGSDGLGSRVRHFSIANTTLMTSLFMDGSGFSDNLAYRARNFIVDPFVGFGLGLAFNNMKNFDTDFLVSGHNFSAIDPYMKTSFAYQAALGVNLKTSSGVTVGLGYRYLNAGRFSSGNQITNTQTTVASWTGTLVSNELYATLGYRFS